MVLSVFIIAKITISRLFEYLFKKSCVMLTSTLACVFANRQRYNQKFAEQDFQGGGKLYHLSHSLTTKLAANFELDLLQHRLQHSLDLPISL
jgi:hypothetical protein